MNISNFKLASKKANPLIKDLRLNFKGIEGFVDTLKTVESYDLKESFSIIKKGYAWIDYLSSVKHIVSMQLDSLKMEKEFYLFIQFTHNKDRDKTGAVLTYEKAKKLLNGETDYSKISRIIQDEKDIIDNEYNIVSYFLKLLESLIRYIAGMISELNYQYKRNKNSLVFGLL